MIKTILLFSVLILLILILWVYLKYFSPLRPKEDGFEFVYVEADGNVRELNSEERKYLSEEFYGSDGGRPYIKSSYGKLTPEGKISGFINRRRVPKKIVIKK
ncbi:hypothetical protein [Flavobacterium sp. 25HG05S-40]|uniref:hypothetical protein n=1 Tax=Flavobacterium sp. 25HG05S-40 TaxID=3458682 RepID=UPI004044B2D4